MGASGIPAWVEPGAVFDADYANDRYFWNGIAYPDETAFNTAVGGSKSGITRTFGPYVDPTGTNLLTNGNFASDVSGWAAGQTGSSIAWAAGELELTSSGSLNGFSQQANGIAGRAFRARATGRRGTSANSFFLFNGANSILSTGTNIGTAYSSTSPTVREGYLAGFNPSYVGVRNTSGVGSGTALFDDFSLVEVWPFLGWTHNAYSVIVDATAPAAASTDEVLLQGDVGYERDRFRIVRQVSNDHLLVIFTVNNAANVTLDLGEVADGEDFTVAMSAAPSSYSASLNGGAPVSSSSGAICPAASYMRVGRSFTGDSWTGTIERVTVL